MNLAHEDPTIASQYLGPDHRAHKNGTADYNAWLERTTRDSIAQLRGANRKIVLLEPIPFKADFDSLSCLSRRAWSRNAGTSWTHDRRASNSSTAISTSRTTKCGRWISTSLSALLADL